MKNLLKKLFIEFCQFKTKIKIIHIPFHKSLILSIKNIHIGIKYKNDRK